MSLKQRKFAHRKMVDVFGGGKLRVACSCGKHSEVFVNTETLTAKEQGDSWFLNHTGLMEVQPRARRRDVH